MSELDVLLKLRQIERELNELRRQMASGDMLKSVYDANNNGIVDAAESVPWAQVTGRPEYETGSYSPSWIGDITNPSIGNGTLVGYYSRVGNVVTMSIRLVMGSTTTYGSGAWSFGLPFTSNGGAMHLFVAYLRDTSTSTNYHRIGIIAGASGIVQAFRGLADGTNSNAMNATTPFTWANGDEIRIAGTYIAAP